MSINSDNVNLKAAARISIFLLVILFVGSIAFYKERMIFTDGAFVAFNMIQAKSFYIPMERFGAFISQVLPLWAIKAGWSLKAVLILYSLSFNLFYLIIGIILYKLRQFDLVILMAFFFSLYVSDSYYWTNNELRQGIAWMFLNFGLLNILFAKYGHRLKVFLPVSLIVFIPLSFVCIYTHPLIMIVLAFLWGFFMITGRPFYHSLLSIPYGLIIIGLSIFKYYSSAQNGYDPGIMQRVTGASLTKILEVFTGGTANDFWHTGLADYWLLWVLFLVGCGSLLWMRKYWVLAFIVLSCIGYFIILCLAFDPGYRFHIESEWGPLAILGSIAFVCYSLPKLKLKYVVVLMSAVFLVRLTYIGLALPKFTHRIDYLEGIVAKMQKRNITKMVLINDGDLVERDLIMAWAMPYETLFISILNNDTNRTVAYVTPERIAQIHPDQNRTDFINLFATEPIDNLNRKYFRLDTVSSYRVVTLHELDQM